MRSKLIMMAAVVMGLVTTVLFFKYIKQFDTAQAVQTNTVEAIVARQPIKKNQKITADMLETVRLPEAGVHPMAIKSVEEANGKFADAVIETGEPLLSYRLKGEKEEAVLVSRKVRDGYRAVSVGVNFVQSVSNLIEPEDEVDVVYTLTDKATGISKSTLLLEKVRVLAVGRKMVEPTAETPYAEYSSVTLELKPPDAVTVIQADEAGTVSLILHTRLIPAK